VVLVVGSRNSSNSQRLVDTAKELGKRAYLLDDQSQLDPAWLAGANGVFVTAGASAPERLVQDLVGRLEREFGGVVEARTLVEEDVAFAPPKSLRSLAVVD
jgi:4-hydroxy-3-methylbut-2-enyl diphosphate reductase